MSLPLHSESWDLNLGLLAPSQGSFHWPHHTAFRPRRPMNGLLLDTGGLAGAAPSQTQNDDEQLPEQKESGVTGKLSSSFQQELQALWGLQRLLLQLSLYINRYILLTSSSEVRAAASGVS